MENIMEEKIEDVKAVENKTTPTSEIKNNSIITDELKSFITETVRRATQSNTDKLANQTKKELNDFREQLKRLEELQTQGLTKEQALWQMDIEDKLNEIKPPASNQNADNDIELTYLRKLGIDANSPEVISIQRSEKALADRLVKYTDLLKSKEANNQNPSLIIPAVQVTEGTQSINLDAQYQKEMKERPKGVDVARWQVQLMKKYREIAKNTGAKFSY